MKKEFQTGVRFEEAVFPGQRVVTLDFDEPAIIIWSIALCMVKAKILDYAIIAGTGAPTKLELSLLRNPQRGERAKASLAQGTLGIAVSETELDFWITFFLKYLRDGYGAVDHLDVETRGSSAPESLDLVLRVPLAAAAFSATEARRRLGL